MFLIFLTAVIFAQEKRECWMGGFLGNYPESMQGGHAMQGKRQQQQVSLSCLPLIISLIKKIEIQKESGGNPKKKWGRNQLIIQKVCRAAMQGKRQQQQVSPSSRISQTISHHILNKKISRKREQKINQTKSGRNPEKSGRNQHQQVSLPQNLTNNLLPESHHILNSKKR